jgi:hypothetical protein
MLGVDDNDPDHLKLVPRYPASWTHAAVTDFPVLTGNARQLMSYDYERNETRDCFQVALQRQVERLSVRLGPYPAGTRITDAICEGRPVPFEVLDSGDSRWVWVRDVTAKQTSFLVEKAPVTGREVSLI